MNRSFTIVTDTAANLPTPLIEEHGIVLLPLTYHFEGKERACLNTVPFNGEEGEYFYKKLCEGEKVTTSQVPPQRYIEALEPRLARGEDILFVGLSSGLSSSYHSSEVAAEQLREAFPERKIFTFDTLAASLGEGKAVLHAVEYRDKGMSIEETYEQLHKDRDELYQVVILDDLMFLHRGGRVSAPKALLGKLIGIRPILKGDEEGHLVVCDKAKGRARGIGMLVQKYTELIDRAREQLVCIAYTDCPEDAHKLKETLSAIFTPKQFLIERYEPVTGSYVGPGTIALFFEGKKGVRAF